MAGDFGDDFGDDFANGRMGTAPRGNAVCPARRPEDRSKAKRVNEQDPDTMRKRQCRSG
jgi:hypothetical protein